MRQIRDAQPIIPPDLREKPRRPVNSNVRCRMKYRLLAAIVCTSFSFMAIHMSISIGSPIFIAAWVAYFLIIYFWVKTNRAPKALLIAGSLLGLVSVIGSYFVGLMWAFPSIALMFHVIWCSYRAVSPNISYMDSPEKQGN